METLLFYHSPVFSLIMMRVGAEDQELGQSLSLFSCFLLAGVVVWTGSSGSCVLVEALIAVL
jgi:hypothetical protein